jgi:hypothetical protein
MPTRWVLYPEKIETDVHPAELLGDLAREVARDAQEIVAANSHQSGRLEIAVHVDEVDDDRAIVAADPRNPRSSPEEAGYAFWVERGTSDTNAEPYLRPALYRHRSP